MKTFKITLGIIALILFSCEGTSPAECKVQNIKVACSKANVYNKMLDIEESINKTFQDDTPSLKLEEKLQLRESFVEHYEKNASLISEVYNEIKDSVPFGMKPEKILDMRKGEIDFFKGQLAEREKTKKFIETLSITTYEKDTSLSEYSGIERCLVMRITNTSDRPINGIAINKNYLVNGQLELAKSPTNYLIVPDQISPKPEGEAIVHPGATLILTFDTSDKRKAQPEIVQINKME